MKSTNAVRTEIHYAQVGEYQLQVGYALLTRPPLETNGSKLPSVPRSTCMC